MRLYKSHKVVAAAVIVSVIADEEGKKLPQYVLDDGDTVVHPQGTNYLPKVGDYYVVYEDSYASLSPKAAFENGYVEYVVNPVKSGMSFGNALVALRNGQKVSREEWRSANSIAVLELCVVEFHAPYFRMGHFEKHNEPLYVMQGPSVEDMTADDWFIPRGDENDDEPELPLYEKDRECQGKCGECECGSDKGNPHRHGSKPVENGSNDYMVPSATDARSCGTCAFGELVKGVNAKCDECERYASRPHWQRKPDEAEESLRP